MAGPRKTLGALALVCGLGLAACTAASESAARRELDRRGRELSLRVTTERQDEPFREPKGVADYVAYALRHNPEIQASFERWRASVHRISRARRLPEPTVSFGYFVRSVETRVGPQRARLGLQQAFPWPTRLSAGADAASAKARAMQAEFEAQALSVSERVSLAYWTLWEIRTTRTIHREHLEVIRALSESVRSRMATGASSLADLQQIDLAAARVEDNLNSMDEAEQGAAARLRATCGLSVQTEVPTPGEPVGAVLPEATGDALTTSARSHPRLERLDRLADASEEAARAEEAERYPSFTIGADWIVTGEAAMAGVDGSGRDAVMIGAGVKAPLWQGSYGDSVSAAKADARGHRAEKQALMDLADAKVVATMSALRNATRRVQLYRGTLVPQAETTYEAVLGAYTVGQGTIAQALLSQRDLLELRIELSRARAEHARIWATLEELVGHPVEPAAKTSNP